jgi:hypothetical protein
MFYDEHRFLYVSGNVILHLCDGWLHDFLSNFVADGYSGRFRRQFFNLRADNVMLSDIFRKLLQSRRHLDLALNASTCSLESTPCSVAIESLAFLCARDVMYWTCILRDSQCIAAVSTFIMSVLVAFVASLPEIKIYGRAIDLYRMTIETAYKQLWTRRPYQFTVTCRKSHDIYFSVTRTITGPNVSQLLPSTSQTFYQMHRIVYDLVWTSSLCRLQLNSHYGDEHVIDPFSKACDLTLMSMIFFRVQTNLFESTIDFIKLHTYVSYSLTVIYDRTLHEPSLAGTRNDIKARTYDERYNHNGLFHLIYQYGSKIYT